jgi:hypothetical protein
VKLTKEQEAILNGVIKKIADLGVDLEAAIFSEEDWNEDMYDSDWEALSPNTVRSAWGVSYGPGDLCLMLMVYDNFIEVGKGEAMRPYIEVLVTENIDLAIEVFVKEVEEMIQSVLPPTTEQLEAWAKELEEARDHFGDKKK